MLAIRACYLDAARLWQVYVFKPLATLLVLALALSFPASPPPTAGPLRGPGVVHRWGHFSHAAARSLHRRPRQLSRRAPALHYAFSIGVPFGAARCCGCRSSRRAHRRSPGVARSRARLARCGRRYVLVIAAMAGQAAGAGMRWARSGAMGRAGLAALFVLSDSILAINRFRAPFARSGR